MSFLEFRFSSSAAFPQFALIEVILIINRLITISLQGAFAISYQFDINFKKYYNMSSA